MTQPTTDELQAKLAKLEYENNKLKRINQALIERVEAATSDRSDPYAAFEHSVILAEQVRERTDALNIALEELKHSNLALTQANQQAALSHQLLDDAIKNISDGFVLFCKERKVVMFNSKFGDFCQSYDLTIKPGITLNEIVTHAKTRGVVTEEVIREQGESSKILLMANNRWVQVSERLTQDGGLVILYTDITKVKASETLRREQALAEKNRILQNTVNNLSQGIALINAQGRLEVWNNRFSEITGLESQQLLNHPQFGRLMQDCEVQLLTPERSGTQFQADRKWEQHLDNGLVLEIRTHPMPHGGYVNTYTDITERHHYAETFRKNERWLRLITDNIPALIAYVGADLRYHFTNKVYDQWYGWPRGSLFGQHIDAVHGEGLAEELRSYISRVMQGNSVTFEIEEANQQGELCYMLKSYVPNLDSKGKVVGFFVLSRDDTERRRSAEALKQAYQHLEQRVRERTSELQSLNDQLHQEIFERKAIESRLIDARKEAEQANLSKTKFLAAVSHDLLQPLNAARLFTSALLEHHMQPSTTSLVTSVSHSLADVESLLSTLVDISKLDAGVVTADRTTFRCSDLLDNLANEFRQLAHKQGLDLHYSSCDTVIHSDSQLLARVLRNFLTNAIRYTLKGQISLSCRVHPEGVVIDVEDTGIGIPEEKLGEIFQEFKRLNKAGHGGEKGLGLGLAIVDKIARVLDHPIDVSSRDGQGSIFSIEVPLGKLSPLNSAGHLSAQINTSPLADTRIWVIDNEQAICDGMAALLSGWGCEVTTALSLEELVERVDIEQDPVDLLIADYHLDDGVVGVDVVQEINRRRQQQSQNQVPVLMITANYNQGLKEQIKSEGYLLMNKPVKPLKLKTTMSHLLKR